MVSVTDLYSDEEFFDSSAVFDDVDLVFLEAMENNESLFSLDGRYFESLKTLAPQPAFVPSLHSSVFEKPIDHALWCAQWPPTPKHFPA